jgi:hypothetical protein
MRLFCENLPEGFMSIVEIRPANSKKLLRQALVWVMLLACIVILAKLLPGLLKPEQLAADDFVSYWSAARLNVSGGNPFSPDQMAILQSRTGRANVPLMMWDLPWLLTITMPFGLLPYFSARMIWFFANLLIVGVCASWLWSFWGGPGNKAWIAWIVGFVFGPTLQLIKIGQIDGLFLVGVVGFLHFEKRKNWWLAGVFLSLLTFKPHILYLVLLTALLWSIQQKRWQVIAGLAGGVCGLMAISGLVNPRVLSQYIYAITHSPIGSQATASLGVGLRLWLGTDKFWLQFIPPLLGIFWCCYTWWTNRRQWVWSERISILILVSVATAAYGWTYDQSVLLIPMILVSVWCSKRGWNAWVALLYFPYLLVNLLLLSLKVDQSAYWWLGLGFLLWFLWAQDWFAKEMIPVQLFNRS